MVEGTPLLREHTAYTRIEGSNPSVSASKMSTTVDNNRETRMFTDIAGFFVSVSVYSRVLNRKTRQATGLPHARGGVSDTSDITPTLLRSSPRTWGWVSI